MFRSLFARMLITISLVLTVSFLILSLILANFANEYELERRGEELMHTATAARTLMQELFELEGDAAAGVLGEIGRYTYLFRIYLSNTEETVILLCDPEGRILLSEDGTQSPPRHVGAVFPRELLRTAGDDGHLHASATFPLGENGHPYCIYPLLIGQDELAGYLVAYSTMESFGGMTQPLINTVLLTSLWIILGALVVKYRMAILKALRFVTGQEIFPKEFYVFNELPAHIIVSDLVLIAVISILLCTLGAVIPAIRAAKLDPAKALRYE